MKPHATWVSVLLVGCLCLLYAAVSFAAVTADHRKQIDEVKKELGKVKAMIAKKDFEQDFPQASKWMEDFSMDSDTLYSLENALVNSGAKASEYPAITEQWASEHQDFVDSLTSGK